MPKRSLILHSSAEAGSSGGCDEPQRSLGQYLPSSRPDRSDPKPIKVVCRRRDRGALARRNAAAMRYREILSGTKIPPRGILLDVRA